MSPCPVASYRTSHLPHLRAFVSQGESGTAFKEFVSLLSFRVYSQEESYAKPLRIQNLFLLYALSLFKVSARVKEKTVPWRHIPTPTAFPHGLQTSFNGLYRAEVDVYL